MIDFKKLAEAIQVKNGYCSLPPRCYATVSAKVTSCTTGKEESRQLPYVIHPYSSNNPSLVFRVLQGATGHESWFIEDLLSRPNDGWWCACAGRDGEWDRLLIDGAEVLEILRRRCDP